MTEFLSAMIGAIVGVVSAFGVQLLQQRDTDRHRVSERKLERYAEFIRGLDDQGRHIHYQRSLVDRLGRLPVPSDAIPDIPRHEHLKLLGHEIRLLGRKDSRVGKEATEALEARMKGLPCPSV